jgi:hypothetical protein
VLPSAFAILVPSQLQAENGALRLQRPIHVGRMRAYASLIDYRNEAWSVRRKGRCRPHPSGWKPVHVDTEIGQLVQEGARRRESFKAAISNKVLSRKGTHIALIVCNG